MSEQSLNPLVHKLQLFFDIARMRRGPQDLPFNSSSLVATVFAYGLMNLVFTLVLPHEAGQPMALVLVDIAVTLVSLRLLLQLARKPERFVQTASAIFGFQIVLGPLLLALAWLSMRYGEDPTWQTPVAVLRFAIAVWVLAVASRVLRAATEWPLAACVAVTIALELFTLGIILLLFPQVLATPAQALGG